MFEETLNQFMDRVYIDFIVEKSLVYSTAEARGNPTAEAQLWSLKKTKNYIEHLEKQNGI